jgi:hypothetical protein
MRVLVLVRFKETASQVYTFGFRVSREREREPTHLLIQEPPFPTLLLAPRKSPKANTKQEQPKGYGLKVLGKNPKPKKFFQAYYDNKVD